MSKAPINFELIDSKSLTYLECFCRCKNRHCKKRICDTWQK